MADRLSIEILQSLTPFHPDGRDKVTEASRELLLGCIKFEPRIHKVFFSSFEAQPGLKLVEFRTFPIETLATVFVAEAISKVKDEFSFHSTIEKSRVEEQLEEIYGSLQWKKLGFQLYTLMYPDVVKDTKTNVRLRDFMSNEGHVWAERLVSHVSDPAWTRSIHQRMVRGHYTEEEYNRDMNALFVKLHLLDPQSVIPAYQHLLNQRALPAVNLELATRNYLEGPLDWTTIEHQVGNAERKTSTPVHASRMSLTSDLDVYYGVDVDEFIVTECRNLGLWTGLRPNNCRVVKAKDKCTLM
ncbi:hypothetical protein PoB_006218500 [Plakobranchus ocellatus]|uniref:Uncharacterized protein n=1 Tax=Plakobranchus ocellatus TaxID=259542 RepID=A0AAV4CUX7_9GAST|nr:hypothetical protein PoB_006218500 [Plakobranchus ocellatus]